MRDYTYIDAADDSIMLVCMSVENVCKADYHFKEVFGSWPWANKNVYIKSEPTGLEPMYILMED